MFFQSVSLMDLNTLNVWSGDLVPVLDTLLIAETQFSHIRNGEKKVSTIESQASVPGTKQVLHNICWINK